MKIIHMALTQQLPTKSTEEIKLLQSIAYFPLSLALLSPPQISSNLIILWEYLKFSYQTCLQLYHHFKMIKIKSRFPRTSECHGLQMVCSIQCVDPAWFSDTTRPPHPRSESLPYARHNLNPTAVNLAALSLPPSLLLFHLSHVCLSSSLSLTLWWVFYLAAHLFTLQRSQSRISPVIISLYSPSSPYRPHSSQRRNYMRFRWVPLQAPPPKRRRGGRGG